jgi:hypothetical protein
MTDKYLLMETDAILAEFDEHNEAIELRHFMQCQNPQRHYEVVRENDIY